MKWYIYGLMAALIAGTVKGDNALKKVHFHQSGSHSSPAHIELGNIIFYFDQKPHIENSMVTKGDKTLQILFLPGVGVPPELNESLQKLHNDTKDLHYTIYCTPKTHPRKGLEITLIYPTNKIGTKYKHFDGIKLQKGVTLSLYNKELIQRIQDVDKNIITTASLDTPRIFIDCGHGGMDVGATCYAVQEKDVSLAVGLKLAELLKQKGLTVGLSRESDIAVALDERTRLANEQRADLFVSIHVNATENRESSGIETYCLNDALFSQGDSCLSDTEQQHVHTLFSERCTKSCTLAQQVHDTLIQTVNLEYNVTDRKVKSAVSQVLLGTQMPSILVEVGFITHPDESHLLSQKSYQERLATGISSGILRYLGRL